MLLDVFIEKLRSEPKAVAFEETISVIDKYYKFDETAFSNGDIHNAVGENNGSCKIFSFAMKHQLTEAQTLHCFGDFYRRDVLGNVDGSDHQNIRNFIESGWPGMHFESDALTERAGSFSRVYGDAARNIGMTPKVYRAGGEGEMIVYACRHTLIGLMGIAATDKGVCFAQFGDNEAALITQLKREFPKAELKPSAAQDAPELYAWIEALDQHISEGAPRPDLPLDIRGTAFQMKVWQFLLSVREGDVLSYSELAAQIDRPKAVRAVASACAKNRIGVLVPCHRVVRGDGGLGGYRWGLTRKQALLDAERKRKAG